ncbi:MAG: carboxynorspermidine decarboxylase [Lachnospiraceae bacterium]|nr:carboxynorspermidine decarboxylase [Lachnospiraceae bacterium]
MDISGLPTPCYVVDEDKLIHNLTILKEIEETTGAKILLAQKAFSFFHSYPLIANYISGTTASGLYEARLGREEMKKENHVYAPAYKYSDMEELVRICDHIIFNSEMQYEQYHNMCKDNTSIGLRINPECSTQEGHEIYDPCSPGSRLGITPANFEKFLEKHDGRLPNDVDGLHFHTLCEQNSDALEITWKAVEEKFATSLSQIKWLNMGGGHHITRPDYDRELLKNLVVNIKQKYDIDVYLEPGEAIALNAGYFVTEVLDVVHNDIDVLILDGSAACHMPDVLEMPYRPPLQGAGLPNEKKHTYRLASATCLAGDVIGDYSFDHEVSVGDRLVFDDMAIYSMVKNNTFNGTPLPCLIYLKQNGEYEMVRKFGYEDFKNRLS